MWVLYVLYALYVLYVLYVLYEVCFSPATPSPPETRWMHWIMDGMRDEVPEELMPEEVIDSIQYVLYANPPRSNLLRSNFIRSNAFIHHSTILRNKRPARAL